MARLTIVACLMLTLGLCEAARILGLLPFFGVSHNHVTVPLFEELAKRGHNVTVAGFFEPKIPHPNYKTILFKTKEGTPMRGFLSVRDYENSNHMTTMYLINNILQGYDDLIKMNNYSRILEETYDLVITEIFESDLFVGYMSRIASPFILVHTCEPLVWHRDTLGDPISPSLIPQSFSKRSSGMGFADRFWNTVDIIQMMLYYRSVMLPKAQEIAEKYLGQLPPLGEITKNTSLYFTNTHFSMYGPRPMNPSTIEIGGIHVFPPKQLPKDLKKLMDNAKNGVIYFSMGSLLKGSTMSSERRDAILKVFSELNETVLWKWEEDLPYNPPNLHSSPWLPQRDIFAHPNLVLYIGHCGVLGVHEALTEALPVVCIPMFGDQHFNAAALKKNGMSLSLNYAEITVDSFRDTINQVLKNPSFKENAKRVSAAFRDRPMSAMDTAVYWAEYVIRHKGAPHLKTPARFMTWWEYYNLDVLGTLFLIALAVVVLTYKMLKVSLLILSRRDPCKKMKTW